MLIEKLVHELVCLATGVVNPVISNHPCLKPCMRQKTRESVLKWASELMVREDNIASSHHHLTRFLNEFHSSDHGWDRLHRATYPLKEVAS